MSDLTPAAKLAQALANVKDAKAAAKKAKKEADADVGSAAFTKTESLILAKMAAFKELGLKEVWRKSLLEACENPENGADVLLHSDKLIIHGTDGIKSSPRPIALVSVKETPAAT